MSFIKSGLILIGLLAAAVAGLVYSGAIYPGADQPHSTIVSKLIETARERAIAVRARDVSIPPLGDAAQLKSGAGNYAAMCTGCHLAPGMEPTELSEGLYPAPPALAELGAPDPARTFWVIKHGVKASGMPAWGKSMSDEYIWNMVAFLQQMPQMSPRQYQALVASSSGHDHGGGESMPRHEGTSPVAGEHTNRHGSTEVAPHDDTGSARHSHEAPASTTASHDDADAPPLNHDAPAPPAPDDTGSPPHDH